MPARLMAPRTAVAPSSVALTPLSTPPSEPTGVRAPATIKISWGVNEEEDYDRESEGQSAGKVCQLPAGQSQTREARRG